MNTPLHPLVRLARTVAAHQGNLAMARCIHALQGFATSQGVATLRVVGDLGQTMDQGRSGKARREVENADTTH